jgi:hypothetical protein
MSGEPLAEEPWNFSGRVVALVQSREQAEATIRFFGFLRTVILASPQRGQAIDAAPPRISLDDSSRWARGEFSADVLLRALQAIAFEPAGRADTLLALDVHSAYLRGTFGQPEPA